MGRWITLGALGAALMLPRPAQAGGIEYTGQGSQSLARGGAVAARAADPMVLSHNPAGLAELRGTQLLFNLNLALFDACFDPSGFYGWGTYLGGLPSEFPDPKGGDSELVRLGEIEANEDGEFVAAEEGYYADPLDTVCLEQSVVPIPQLAWTTRVSEKLGIGFGLLFPAAQPAGQWGGDNAVIRGDDGDLRPAPTRYMQFKSNNIGVFPTIGAGYRIMDELRIGAAFEWGILAVDNWSVASATGGNTPANGIIAHVNAQDFFVPGFTVSTHLVPVDAIDIVLAFRYQDPIDASGQIDLTTGLFDPALTPHENKNFPVESLHQNMPWKLSAGIRYADRLLPRPVGTGQDETDPSKQIVIHDPLQDERWDIEFDVEYQMNSRVEESVIEYCPPGPIEDCEINQLTFEPLDGSDNRFTEFPNSDVPNTTVIKNWDDQISLRLGGTYNFLPGLFGVSAGAHYETRGVDPAYMNIDFWPVSRVGLHTGVIFRVMKSVDFTLSYAHIFQETIVVAAPEHKLRGDIEDERFTPDGTLPVENIDKTVGAMTDRFGGGQSVLEEDRPDNPDGEARLEQNLSSTAGGQPPYIVNSGRYRSNFDIISVGMNLHF